MKKTITTILITLIATTLWAQGSSDACRYSQTYYQGTAKALGMGNALGAVGGDMTALCINPAGMGLYRSSEFTTTISLSNNNLTSTYYGESGSNEAWQFSVPNIGIIFTRQRSNYKPMRYMQFGISHTRTNEFNMHSLASGFNPTSSKIDNYLMRMDGYWVSELQNKFPYDIYPAWETYLLDVIEHGIFTSPVPQGGINQSFDQEYKGRSGEWDFAYSFNLNDRFFFGINLGLVHIKRYGTSVLKETLPNDSDIETDFREWTFTEDISSSGIGLNGKIGLIWIANRWLRLGASYHSPSWYSFNEKWQTKTESLFTPYDFYSYSSPESNYKYYFFSPMKWIGSVAFVVSESGLVSFDVEYLNYGAAQFKADDFDYGTVNQEIKDLYGSTLNFRLGTEWRINDSYLRFGTGYYGSPFGLGDMSGSVKKASVGISLPIGTKSSIDLAYELSHGKRMYTLYDAGDLAIEPVTESLWRHVALATLKLRF